MHICSGQSLRHVRLFATPWTTAHQASLAITNSWSLLILMSIELTMPSNHLILCQPLLLLPSVFTSIQVFSNESILRIRWPKYWSFSFNISPSDEYSGLISFRMHRMALLAVLLELNKKLHSVSPSPKWSGESDQGGQGPGLEAVHSVLRAQCPGLPEPPRGHQLSHH